MLCHSVWHLDISGYSHFVPYKCMLPTLRVLDVLICVLAWICLWITHNHLFRPFSLLKHQGFVETSFKIRCVFIMYIKGHSSSARSSLHHETRSTGTSHTSSPSSIAFFTRFITSRGPWSSARCDLPNFESKSSKTEVWDFLPGIYFLMSQRLLLLYTITRS